MCNLFTPKLQHRSRSNLHVVFDISKDDIDFDILSQSKILHFTGYQWDTELQKETIEYVIKTAKEQGLVISFDIADPFCIQRNVDDFKKNYLSWTVCKGC